MHSHLCTHTQDEEARDLLLSIKNGSMEERKARIRQAAKEMGAEDMTDEQVEDSIKKMDHMLDQVRGCALCLAP